MLLPGKHRGEEVRKSLTEALTQGSGVQSSRLTARDSGLFSLLYLVEQEVQVPSQDGVRKAGSHTVEPTPVLRHVDQAPGYRKVDGGMDQVEPQRNQQARSGSLDIELHAQRRRSVAHDGLGNAIDSDGIVSKHVLRKANDRAGEQSGDRTAARHGKEDRHQQRKVEVDGEAGKLQRHKCLEKQREQRNANRYRDAEPVDFNLLP